MESLSEILNKLRNNIPLKEKFIPTNYDISTMSVARLYYRITKKLKIEPSIEWYSFILHNKKKLNFSIGKELSDKLRIAHRYKVELKSMYEEYKNQYSIKNEIENIKNSHYFCRKIGRIGIEYSPGNIITIHWSGCNRSVINDEFISVIVNDIFNFYNK